MGADDVRQLSDWAIEGCWPDLVVLLDIDAALAGQRRSRDRDRLEMVDDAFSARVRTGYLELAAADPQGWVVVDAGGDEETVASAVRQAVTERLAL
jgi:dTMP kinase